MKLWWSEIPDSNILEFCFYSLKLGQYNLAWQITSKDRIYDGVFAKTANGFQLLIIFAKRYILDVCQGCEHASKTCLVWKISKILLLRLRVKFPVDRMLSYWNISFFKKRKKLKRSIHFHDLMKNSIMSKSWTDFYMLGTSVMKELKASISARNSFIDTKIKTLLMLVPTIQLVTIGIKLIYLILHQSLYRYNFNS